MMFYHNIPHRNVYLFSDVHYGHNKDFIWTPRGYENVDAHDFAMKSGFSKMDENSILFLLGDTIFGPNALERLIELLKEIPAREIYLMPGNHYSGLKQLKAAQGRKFKLHEKDINIIENYYEIIVDGQPIVLSHYPIMSWNGMGKGSWMVHGHVHGRIETSLPHVLTGGKILDVGPESVGSPQSFEEIQMIMSKKQFAKVDHHGPDTQNPL